MMDSTVTIINFLKNTSPFNQLESASLKKLVSRLKPLRYKMGQKIIERGNLPAKVCILLQGQARLLAYPPGENTSETLELLQPGAVIGATGLIRDVAIETVICKTESICLTLQASDFLTLLQEEPALSDYFINKPSLIEIYDLLGAELQRRGKPCDDLGEISKRAINYATLLNLPSGQTPLHQLDMNLLWLVSSSGSNYNIGSRLNNIENQEYIQATESGVRLIGFTDPTLSFYSSVSQTVSPLEDNPNPWENVPFASEKPEVLEKTSQSKQEKYPYFHGTGPVNATLACFQMLSEYFNVPWKRDAIKQQLNDYYQKADKIPVELCGVLADRIGLKVQLTHITAETITKLPTPVLLPYLDSFAIIYKTLDKELTIAIPSQGIVRQKTADFIKSWGESGQLLLLKSRPDSPKRRFNLSWFAPAIKKHKKVLIEVLIASLFVQILALANPLITQVIIDKVIIQNGINTLNVLGSVVIVMSMIEGVIGWLRINLFVDTTNRIDFSLGSEVIDHLLKLPLSYFEKQPVGEIATRINELGNIRSFLTNTALTVVLDAIFSCVYIAVMLFYSWILTIVALATVPLFALVTFIFAPIIRNQARTKAEKNAQTQAYLTEVVSGIQTVKTQNIELDSRWQWQRLYGKYISASFQNVITGNTASSLRDFLSKFSNLLLLWVGAYLVLQKQLTLGELIAFRIIAGYVTSPLLRLIQLWQNFQETALSLERLADILDTPQESEIAGTSHISMPTIHGKIKYENVTFSFNKSSNLQLNNVSLEIPKGAFVGIVGQSGSGKSTLTKLIPRLYEADAEKILIDGYDINKVDLYSLRQQIGVVQQETLLFNTTIQENIALTMPDATLEDIILAAKIACAHDFIEDLASSYSTRVGEKGAGLSGGQRQRIAIARTVLQNPPLLIMDEATSALDYLTEKQVCKNLQAAFKGRTVLFITHRLATIKNADIILVMNNGKLAEQGTHHELMSRKGLYYCLYQQQIES
jgi:HlyB family type I secretion system ABC transporter